MQPPHIQPKVRLDQLLVDQGVAASRAEAQRLVMRGLVRVAGQPATKPGHRMAPDAPVTIEPSARYVSRGGEKLAGALAALALSVRERVAMDVGASTGGFTDCLLQHGARRVYAVDVGYGQLAWSLRQDPRVVMIERTNIRTLSPAAIPEPVNLVTADLSFISLRLVLPLLRPFLGTPADLVVLVKPQFEVGRRLVGRGGVVRDPALREGAVRQVSAVAESAGYQVKGWAPSILPGSKGNQEYFLWLGFSKGGHEL
jgi:23S rRNA (cytidine1920-2'-O)/16S rRNA (cytidine1409-2'-O)-methyltransferase